MMMTWYTEYFKNLHIDTYAQLNNRRELDILRWMTFVFEVNVADVSMYLQENLIKLQGDEIFQAKLNDGQHNVGKRNDTIKMYPLLWWGSTVVLYSFSFIAPC